MEKDTIYNFLSSDLYALSTSEMIPGGSVQTTTKTAAEVKGEEENSINKDLSLVGGRVMTVAPGGDIQAAIDTVFNAGGGEVRLYADTYLLTSDINMKSGVSLVGSTQSGTILDFQGGAYQIKAIGSNAYTTGTVAISDGGSTVTGTGTTFTAAMVGKTIIFKGTAYTITQYNSATSINITPPYFGPGLSGETFVVFDSAEEFELKRMTIQNSTADAVIKVRYRALAVSIIEVFIFTSVSGILIQDTQFPLLRNVVVVGMAGNGITIQRSGAAIIESVDCQLCGGNGIELETVNRASFHSCVFDDSTGNGMTLTTCDVFGIVNCSATRNTAKGIEMTGCNDIHIANCDIEGNGSDGIKLTATSDRVSIATTSIRNNSGYGINIAASTCDNNYIVAPSFSNNTSGTISDLGTGTVIISANLSALLYGDGADGDVTISVNTTLTSDKYYTNLTINTGVTLDPGGYRIFVTGRLTFNGTGKISGNGNAGGNGTTASSSSGAAAGGGATALADGYLKGSLAGGGGGAGGNGGNPSVGPVQNGSNGSNGVATSNSLGSNSVGGAAGGNGATYGGGAAAGTGGAAGSLATITASLTRLATAIQALTLLDVTATGATIKYDNSASAGGSGGGGGGTVLVGSGSPFGGGGGGGGGAGSPGRIVAIFAKTIIGTTASITSNGGSGGNGGNGANGSASGTSQAGGGGGGGGGSGGNGGIVVLVYNNLIGATATATGGSAGTLGTGGTGANGGNTGSSGSAGNAGSAGTVYQIQLSL